MSLNQKFEFGQISDNMSLDELLNIPNSVLDEMLSTGADIGITAMKKSLADKGLVKSGQLRDSLTKKPKKGKDGRPYYEVYPTGKRKEGNSNNDVGFVQEFGAGKRNIKAKQWMRSAMEQNADKIINAELEIYDKYLKEK